MDTNRSPVDAAVRRWLADQTIISDQVAATIAAGWQTPHGDGWLFAQFASAIIAGRWVAPEGILDAIAATIADLPNIVAADPTGYVPGGLGSLTDNLHQLRALAAHIRYCQSGLPGEETDPVTPPPNHQVPLRSEEHR